QLEALTPQPASSSTACSGDDWMRSVTTTVAIGLGQSFYWAGSAASQGASTASSGELQLGTLRTARSANVLGGFGDGFLGLHQNNKGLYHIGSTWTGLLGHPNMLDAGAGVTFPTSVRWLVQEGRFTSSGTTTNVSFPVPYSVAPAVYLAEGFIDTSFSSQQLQFFAF